MKARLKQFWVVVSHTDGNCSITQVRAVDATAAAIAVKKRYPSTLDSVAGVFQFRVHINIDRFRAAFAIKPATP